MFRFLGLGSTLLKRGDVEGDFMGQYCRGY